MLIQTESGGRNFCGRETELEYVVYEASKRLPNVDGPAPICFLCKKRGGCWARRVLQHVLDASTCRERSSSLVVGTQYPLYAVAVRTDDPIDRRTAAPSVHFKASRHGWAASVEERKSAFATPV